MIEVQIDDPIPNSFNQDFESQKMMNDLMKEKMFKNDSYIYVEDIRSKELAGIFVVFDQDQPQDSIPFYSDRYKSMITSLVETTKNAKENHPELFTDETKKMRVRLIIVFREHRGKGILNHMYNAFENIAESRGFNTIHMTCGAPETFHLCKKFGYQTLGEFRYLGLEPELLQYFKPSDEIKMKFRGEDMRIQYNVKIIQKQREEQVLDQIE
ncbi:UNKNOWN [Stylonychia lemnae]|uniref:N-acetyltransferase domain-containing protein n=1 Tax=Stylonychia lemnae TaxID=5949 RepID=A0A078AAQ9_STYLE|nr:UNKNOWN [Stylonychia lemnae]|eukprot:CDW78926.1 UNKNOWN [Stylonychia lemnae]